MWLCLGLHQPAGPPALLLGAGPPSCTVQGKPGRKALQDHCGGPRGLLRREEELQEPTAGERTSFQGASAKLGPEKGLKQGAGAELSAPNASPHRFKACTG